MTDEEVVYAIFKSWAKCVQDMVSTTIEALLSPEELHKLVEPMDPSWKLDQVRLAFSNLVAQGFLRETTFNGQPRFALIETQEA